MNENYYLEALDSLVKGYFVLAQAYHNHHVSGFSDWKNAFQMHDVGQDELAKTIVDNINDDELFKATISIKEHLQELKDVDKQITIWLVRFVGLSSLHDDKDKAQFEQRLRKIVTNGPDGHPQGPIWAMHPDYLVLVEKSGNILADMGEVLQRISQRLQHLKGSTA